MRLKYVILLNNKIKIKNIRDINYNYNYYSN